VDFYVCHQNVLGFSDGFLLVAAPIKVKVLTNGAYPRFGWTEAGEYK